MRFSRKAPEQKARQGQDAKILAEDEPRRPLATPSRSTRAAMADVPAARSRADDSENLEMEEEPEAPLVLRSPEQRSPESHSSPGSCERTEKDVKWPKINEKAVGRVCTP
ncbi:unnamed protein product [Effrenium voratum]|nr:unnamed protein product [Effrenium voratum]